MMFFNKEKMEYTEKEVIDEYIYNLIDTVSKNNDVDGYVSIIAILHKLKKTYPRLNDIYNKYLKQLDKYTDLYNKTKNSNGVYISLNTLSQFDEPSWDLIPDRYLWFSTCLALLGTPKTPKVTNQIAKWCSWNYYCFAKSSIYYTKLLINQGFDDESGGGYYDSAKEKLKNHRFNIYLQLAENYTKIKDYDSAIKYYKKASKYKLDFKDMIDKKIEQCNKYKQRIIE